jgi:ribosomal protein S18 acetylase RimI-like enzyme
MHIRTAVQQDIPQIMDLYRELDTQMSILYPEKYVAGQRGETYISRILEDPANCIFLAEEDGEVLGFAHVFEKESQDLDFIVHHRYAFLADLVIAYAHRGRRIGELLFKEVQAWGRSRQLEFLQLRVLSNNIGAMRFYEHYGMQEFNRTLECPL